MLLIGVRRHVARVTTLWCLRENNTVAKRIKLSYLNAKRMMLLLNWALGVQVCTINTPYYIWKSLHGEALLLVYICIPLVRHMNPLANLSWHCLTYCRLWNTNQVGDDVLKRPCNMQSKYQQYLKHRWKRPLPWQFILKFIADRICAIQYSLAVQMKLLNKCYVVINLKGMCPFPKYPILSNLAASSVF